MTHKESLEQSQNYGHNINCKFSLLLGEAITSNNIDITNIYIYIYIYILILIIIYLIVTINMRFYCPKALHSETRVKDCKEKF